MGFENNDVRRLFIRKVYAILSVQLIVTACFVAAFMGIDSVNSNEQLYFLVSNYLRIHEGRWNSNSLRKSRCLHDNIFLPCLPLLQLSAQISSQCHHAFRLHDCNVCCSCCDSFQLSNGSCSSCSCDDCYNCTCCHRIARDLPLYKNIISKAYFEIETFNFSVRSSEDFFVEIRHH